MSSKKPGGNSRPGLVARTCAVGLNGDHLLNLRNNLLERPLNALLEGPGRHRSPVTGAFQSYLDDSVILDRYQFNVSAIALEKRSNLIEHAFNPIFHAETSFERDCNVHRYFTPRAPG